MKLIGRLIDELKRKPNLTSVVVNVTEQAIGERPSVTFAKLWNYYLDDPTIQNAVNTFRDQIVGSGFYVTANNSRAVSIINDFCNGIDFDNILYDIVGEMLVCGNSYVEMLGPTNLQDLERLQITTIKKIIRDRFGRPTHIVQEVDGVEHQLDPKNFIHFRLFDVARRPFGIGLFHALAVPQVIDGENRPSILESVAMIRDSMVRIFDNYSSPKDLYVFENASEQFLQDQATKMRNMKKGESFLTNKKFEHHELTIDPRSRFDKYIEFLQTQLELGSQTPAAKLQTTTGYTEASARAVIELVERRIIGIQRRLKRTIEKEIFERVLIREGLNVERASLELHWGQPDIPEFNIQDVFRAKEIGIISRVETRNILQKSGWELSEPESEPEKQDPDDADLEGLEELVRGVSNDNVQRARRNFQ
jgi:hypothetical protein